MEAGYLKPVKGYLKWPETVSWVLKESVSLLIEY